MEIDENFFRQTQRDRERGVAPGVEATRDIQVGNVSGKKYVYRLLAPVQFKRVDYVLRVPGGFALAAVEAAGADFDEAPFESQLHTLRLWPSAYPTLQRTTRRNAPSDSNAARRRAGR